MTDVGLRFVVFFFVIGNRLTVIGGKSIVMSHQFHINHEMFVLVQSAVHCAVCTDEKKKGKSIS